jgi:hypothetical protein
MSDLPTLLERKSRTVSTAERLEFLAIRAIAMGDKTDLLKEFGIDQKKISFEAERYLGKQISKHNEPQVKRPNQPVITANPIASNLGSLDAQGAADFFANLGSQKPEAPQPASIP